MRDTGWFATLVAPGEVHVYPAEDAIDHYAADSTLGVEECVCGPDVEFLENGPRVLIHHSLDGREQHESA